MILVCEGGTQSQVDVQCAVVDIMELREIKADVLVANTNSTLDGVIFVSVVDRLTVAH